MLQSIAATLAGVAAVFFALGYFSRPLVSRFSNRERKAYDNTR